jgi:hypothetical protein
MLQCRQNTTWHFHRDAIESLPLEFSERLQVDVPLGYPKHWHLICLAQCQITLGNVMCARQQLSDLADHQGCRELGGSG